MKYDVNRPVQLVLSTLMLAVSLCAQAAEPEVVPISPTGFNATPKSEAGALTVELADETPAAAAPSAPARTATPVRPAGTPAGATSSAARSEGLGSKRGPSINPAGKTDATAAAAPASRSVERVERLVFDRRPVRIALAVGRERLVTFSGPVALHTPEDAEGLLKLQIIGSTAYLSATAPFGTMRVIAEDLENDGAQIPIDLIADKTTAQANGDVEVFAASALRRRAATAAGQQGASERRDAGVEASSSPDGAADMVALTRFAARAIYAPKRLIPADPGIRQVPVALEPVAGLVRGFRMQAAPLGSWRSGPLYVTAVRLTNEERIPVELDLSDLRGQWLAASSQHARLGPAGWDSDTTTLYLVCDRPFEACR